jgi:hypothetical protein
MLEDIIDCVLEQSQLFVTYYDDFCEEVQTIHHYFMPFPPSKIAFLYRR